MSVVSCQLSVVSCQWAVGSGQWQRPPAYWRIGVSPGIRGNINARTPPLRLRRETCRRIGEEGNGILARSEAPDEAGPYHWQPLKTLSDLAIDRLFEEAPLELGPVRTSIFPAHTGSSTYSVYKK